MLAEAGVGDYSFYFKIQLMLKFLLFNLNFNFNITLYDSISQFDSIQSNPICAYDILFYLTNSIFINNTLIYCLFFFLLWKWRNFLITKISNIRNSLFDFDQVLEFAVLTNLKNKNKNFVDIVALLFSLILFLNCIALIPFIQCITSQLIFTLFLAIVSLFLIWFQNFYTNKIYIFEHFLPEGAPTILAPFIIFIELVGNLSRIVSLSVRLFANITSGHALLKIIAGFGLLTIIFGFGWKIIILPPIIILCLTTGLEIIIAILQSYVFVSLVLIYISESE